MIILCGLFVKRIHRLLSYSLIRAGCEKLKISTEDCQLVTEDDGTEIDEDVDIVEFAGHTFILLGKDQRWSNASPAGATSTSVPEPEPTKPAEAASQHSPSPARKMSKTFRSVCIVI